MFATVYHLLEPELDVYIPSNIIGNHFIPTALITVTFIDFTSFYGLKTGNTQKRSSQMHITLQKLLRKQEEKNNVLVAIAVKEFQN